jgi:hypothetical protein
MGKNHLGIKREQTRPRPLLLFWAAFYAFLLHPFLLLAQEAPEIDLVAPKILHARPMGIFHGGQEIEIVATVTDPGSGVAGVRLFFRSKGERNYRVLEMIPDTNDRYRATIPGEAAEDPGVEYYLEAEDRAGNRVQTLRPPDLSPTFVEVKSPTVWERFQGNDKPWYKKPWVWTVAGVVVLGAAASMGGGGGGGGGGGAGSPTTGTITVDSPVP